MFLFADIKAAVFLYHAQTQSQIGPNANLIPPATAKLRSLVVKNLPAESDQFGPMSVSHCTQMIEDAASVSFPCRPKTT